MKIRELFEETEKSLVGMKIHGVTDFADEKWPGDFRCHAKELTSLKGAPSEVHGIFNCTNNKLITLEGCPTHIEKDIYCYGNQLESFDFFPKFVGGSIYSNDNKITSFKGLPKKVYGDLNCSKNMLSSFEYAPEFINGDLILDLNKFTSLQNIHKHVKEITNGLYLAGNQIKSHVLGVLRIEGLSEIIFGNFDVELIINKHLQGARNIYDCQEELIEAGFEEFAKL